jgi:hypothetical protein
MSPADIDDDTVAVELIGNKAGVDDECRAVERLSRAEYVAPE